MGEALRDTGTQAAVTAATNHQPPQDMVYTKYQWLVKTYDESLGKWRYGCAFCEALDRSLIGHLIQQSPRTRRFARRRTRSGLESGGH